jgi:hypothetical protein
MFLVARHLMQRASVVALRIALPSTVRTTHNKPGRHVAMFWRRALRYAASKLCHAIPHSGEFQTPVMARY